VLHEVHGGGHSFLVDDAGVIYRYDVGASSDAITPRSASTRHSASVPAA
jgi:hypothetical protein